MVTANVEGKISRREILADDNASGKHQLFHALWAFIILVSVIDGYLVLEYRDYLDELNPQGQVLIDWNDGQVWYLLAAKFCGTVHAAALLRIIYENSFRLGNLIALTLGALQLCLLLFLLLR